MPGVNVPRARRWFWVLFVTAVLASGGLYWAVSAPVGPLAGIVVLVSGLVAAMSLLQAVRVLRALNGPLDLSLSRRRDRIRTKRTRHRVHSSAAVTPVQSRRQP